MKATKNITTGNIYKNYFLYAIPLILSSLLSSAYSTVDSMIAGKFINENALGAISAAASYELLFHAFFNGFTEGFSIYIAHLFGAKNYKKLKQDTVNMITIIALFAIIISTVSIMFRSVIMGYLNVSSVLLSDAKIYFSIHTAGYIFSFTNLLLLHTLYALGVTSFSVFISLSSAILNIAGNLLTVLVFDMGVAGLALSTVISTFAATVFYLVLIKRAFDDLKTEKISYKFSFVCFANSLRYTLPAAAQKLAFHCVNFFIAPAVNLIGAEATTGYTVMKRVYNICGQSFWNASHAVSCYSAQCAGAGEYKKIPRGLKAGFWTNVILLTPFVLIVWILARPIISIFFPVGYEGKAFEYALRFVSVYLPFLYINMVGHLLHVYLRSLGKVNVVFGITIIGSTVQLVSSLLLIPSIQFDGAYIGQAISWSADALISFMIFYFFFRKPEQIEKTLSKNRILKSKK